MKKKKRVLYGVALSFLCLATIAFALFYHANRILKYEIERTLGKGFSVEDLALTWGGIDARNAVVTRSDGKKALSVPDASLRADFIGLLKKNNTISSVMLTDSYLLLEVDNRGKMISPLPARNDAEGKRSGRGRRAERNSSKKNVFFVKSFEVQRGSLDYVDRKVPGGPVVLQFRDLQADVHDLPVPPHNVHSGYALAANILGKQGTGSMKAKGRLNLMTKDTKTKLQIRDLDITQLRPYYEKKGDVEVTRGFLSLDADIAVLNSKIVSSGKIIIHDLDFRRGKGNSFLGLPLTSVIGFLKDSNNKIDFDFTIEGDLDNPKFSITDSLVQKLALSLAKTLGMPIESIGKSVFELGGQALEKLFK